MARDVDDLADDAVGATPDDGVDPSDRGALLERLDVLEKQSLERHAELRELAAQLPAVMSRRSLVSQMARSVREAPDRPTVIKRTLRKVARTPADLARRLRTGA